MESLTELEACVLGLVWSDGPCTAYRVLRMFQSSPSPNWSGSAGSIYPIFRKLEERDLIEAEERSQGRRKSKVYRATAAGDSALKSWIGPPLPEWVADLPIDPIRTRVRFLQALRPAQQRQLIAQAIGVLEGQLEVYRKDSQRLKALDDPFPHAMARGAIHVTRARLAWLAEIRESLPQGAEPGD